MSCSCPQHIATGTSTIAPAGQTRVQNPDIKATDKVSYGIVGWANMAAAENGLVTVAVSDGSILFSSTFPNAQITVSYHIVRSH